MTDPHRVVAYAGYQGEQEPRILVVAGARVPLTIERRWLEPDARCFKVRGGGRGYLLRCLLPELRWTVEEY